MARPRKHDRPAITRAIFLDVSKGMLVNDACRAQGITGTMLREWCADDRALAALYARAREEQSHAIAEQAIAIADGTDDEARQRIAAMADAVKDIDDKDKERILNSLAYAAVQRDRIRVDARKWMASKIAPKLYGEKLQAEISGPGGGPVPVLMIPPEDG